jgi:hypothetical protein
MIKKTIYEPLKLQRKYSTIPPTHSSPLSMKDFNIYFFLTVLIVTLAFAREITNAIQGPGYAVTSNDGSIPTFLKVHSDTSGKTYIDTFFCTQTNLQGNCKVAAIPVNNCFGFAKDYANPTLSPNGPRISSWAFPSGGGDICVGFQDKTCGTQGYDIVSSKTELASGLGGMDLTGIDGLQGGFLAVKCAWEVEVSRGTGVGYVDMKPGYTGP